VATAFGKIPGLKDFCPPMEVRDVVRLNAVGDTLTNDCEGKWSLEQVEKVHQY